MNKTISLAAISMFAVTLGLGLMSPALATQPDGDGEHKMLICHFQEEKTVVNPDGSTTDFSAGWVVIDVDNKGKLNGHFDKDGDARHVDDAGMGDFVIEDDGDARHVDDAGMGDFVIEDDEDLTLCESLPQVEEVIP